MEGPVFFRSCQVFPAAGKWTSVRLSLGSLVDYDPHCVQVETDRGVWKIDVRRNVERSTEREGREGWRERREAGVVGRRADAVRLTGKALNAERRVQRIAVSNLSNDLGSALSAHDISPEWEYRAHVVVSLDEWRTDTVNGNAIHD